MPNTIVSPLVHSLDEHSIVIMPDKKSINQIVAVQNQLKSLLGDAIWLTPPNALHVTLMEVICDTEYKDLSRRQHFSNWYKQYNDLARDTIAQFESLELSFDKLSASTGAIIIKTGNSAPLNAIRKALLANTVLPAQTKMPPDITHCSIARYNEVIDLDTVQQSLETASINLYMRVGEFKLMRDLGPDFHPTTVETYLLNQ